MPQTLKLIAISGSLRAASCNTALLRAVAALAPREIEVTLFEHLAQVPPFNPDIDLDTVPLLAALRDQIVAADGVLIASPEYAHGVSGVMKNLLDWLVNTSAFVNKPVATLNASPRAQHAFESLKETLTMMSAQWLEAASITVPVIGDTTTTEAILRHPQLCAEFRAALAVFTELQLEAVI
ncbi:NAD(P)H-dependent oxidoreductase [Chitinibacter bivalviorum]|uniref:NAD(P)H-dependent oxidoreductase n=1 Tax=Chitinibacter bivalviorum TaxID=2739434 RepID=A0A7H9BLP9_9NEIS|nr:NADPH-dependent FMN reductase [Chitinibacter bivalviorum]QLG89296.1 NAD(P)H-dependent oxidoreductase [Chitinibacter bivalviorum]